MYTKPEKAPSQTATVTLTTLAKMKAAGERIACLTAYDASFAALLDGAGVDLLLVGDSLGMVVQGRDSTVPVTLADMIYHAQLVERGVEAAHFNALCAILIAALRRLSRRRCRHRSQP